MDTLNHCVSCDRSVLRRRKHSLSEVFFERYLDHVVLLLQEIIPREIPFDGTRSLCHPCWQRYDRAVNAQHIRDEVSQLVQNEPVQNASPPRPIQDDNQQIELEADHVREVEVHEDLGFIALPGYRRASNTARHCIFQNCRNMASQLVPTFVKFHLFHNNNFYIPELARVCHPHLIRNDWDDIIQNQTSTHENFNNVQVLDIINLYKWGLERRSQMNFENLEMIDDREMHFWTGLTKDQFLNILEQTPSLRDRSDRPATVLGIYMTKIRTGEPNERLATKFQMSRRTFERKIRIARESLSQDFVHRHLGLDHITREEIVSRNLTLPSHIFNGNENEPAAILVFDGTYIYLQKSSNFLFQRRTYSLHKFRNLVKPLLIVCTDGYIVDVVGPYLATTSDATIMRELMKEDSAWHWCLRPNDTFILDRGFRDSIPDVEQSGYIPHMPPTRSRGEQMSTVEANKSRLITMCRWVIEAINGRFKKDFKIFRNTYFNVAMRSMMTDFKITAAIINTIRQPYEDNQYVQQFIEIINRNINIENQLAPYVIENNLNRQRVAFVSLDGNSPDFEDFPQLTYEDLILFTLGSYHIRIARSYCQEHMRPNGIYSIETYRHPSLINNNILIRGRIQSRHVRRKQYYTYIMVDPSLRGRQAIEKYYCSCIHGYRTIGSCAHIASIVYFLSWARHQEAIDTPAAFLNDVVVDFDEAE